MEVEATFSTFFGSRERSKGSELVRKDFVVISSASDTNVRAFIKGSSSCRVALTADGVSASGLSSSCTCSEARKGILCKHVWAVILKLAESDADFLEGKNQILATSAKSNPSDQARHEKQEQYKTERRERAKIRGQEIRQRKKLEERGPRFVYPPPVQNALDFFAANGFPLEDFEMANLLNARKLLSRVFHPDKGGSHEEILILNGHFDVLENYLKS